MSTEEREKQIVEGAVNFFSAHGLDAQMRDLAKQIGITHPLLYHYFPTKQALIERVYEQVYLGRWKREWEQWMIEPGTSLRARLCHFYQDYAHTVLTAEWVRILLSSGMKDRFIPDRYLDVLQTRIFPLIVQETRLSLNIASRNDAAEAELEHLWGLHGGIFHIGVRVFVYGQPLPTDLDAVIADRVDAYLHGAKNIFKKAEKHRNVAG
ncbi:TetR/AcrR family transcriptional regulator [Caballeronia sordidicola]|uniref:Transcriptional regulator, TetR family n=1 Tax=Caballeronia sordidicola TaxID=196367 RepID=A0A226XA34_CABSO|nr:TetR/AcrR family transcriptional regulator [Caballeronia sordidicola]OXC79807.1 Transcriptional regulator, TetR family [Caballeronia sordidicola]